MEAISITNMELERALRKEDDAVPWVEFKWLSENGLPDKNDFLTAQVGQLDMNTIRFFTHCYRFYKKIPVSRVLLQQENGSLLMALATLWSRTQLEQWLGLPKQHGYADDLVTTFAEYGAKGKIHAESNFRFTDDRSFQRCPGKDLSPIPYEKIKSAWRTVPGAFDKRRALTKLGLVPRLKLESAKGFYKANETVITAEMVVKLGLFYLEKQGTVGARVSGVNECYQVHGLTLLDTYNIDVEAARLLEIYN